MTKRLRQRDLLAMLLIVAALVLMVYTRTIKEQMSEEGLVYMGKWSAVILALGVGIGFSGYKARGCLEESVKLENELNDERFRLIDHTAYALTMKITIGLELFLAVVLTFLNQMDLVKGIEILLFTQLIILLLIRIIVKRKM